MFGFNTFLALLFQTCLTMTVADDVGLALPPRQQFAVYGAYWIFIGCVFLVIFAAHLIRNGGAEFVQKYRTEGIWTNNTGYKKLLSCYTR